MIATFIVQVPAQSAREEFTRSDGEVFRFGRAKDGNDVSLPGDVSLSAHHCEFFFRNNVWWVRELSTETGITVNGSATAEQMLANGDHIDAGLARIIFECEETVFEPEAQEKTTPVPVENVDSENSESSLASAFAAVSSSAKSKTEEEVHSIPLDDESSQLSPTKLAPLPSPRAKVREITTEPPADDDEFTLALKPSRSITLAKQNSQKNN